MWRLMWNLTSKCQPFYWHIPVHVIINEAEEKEEVTGIQLIDVFEENDPSERKHASQKPSNHNAVITFSVWTHSISAE